MIWLILIGSFVLAPWFAARESRNAEAQATRLAEEARREIAEGKPPPPEIPPRPLITWPYTLGAVLLAALWTIAGVTPPQTPAASVGSEAITIGVISAAIVWLGFHIFIFSKRMRTAASLLVLLCSIAVSVAVVYGIHFSPIVADLSLRLK